MAGTDARAGRRGTRSRGMIAMAATAFNDDWQVSREGDDEYTTVTLLNVLWRTREGRRSSWPRPISGVSSMRPRNVAPGRRCDYRAVPDPAGVLLTPAMGVVRRAGADQAVTEAIARPAAIRNGCRVS